MTIRKIMMIAGEPSGDLHGSNLIRELKNLSPKIEIFGTGGDRMKNVGAKILFDLKDLAMTGLLDVIRNYFRLKKIQTALLSKIKEERPDLIILIDYPDFNLRFAKKAQPFKTPIVYYISPQIWAWRKGRIKLIKKYIRKIFVIFKFEEELYKKEGVPVEFVGHPLLDIVKANLSKEEFLKLQITNYKLQTNSKLQIQNSKIIALLPGSRKRLIKTLLPIMLKAGEIIYKKFPETIFIISKVPSVDSKIYEKLLARTKLPVSVLEGKTYDLINASDLVLTVSGTSTLETAILAKPMVILYKLPILEYLLARPLLRLKNIGLVNIVAGEEVVPEFLQFKARPKRIAETAIDMLTNSARYNSLKNKLEVITYSLRPAGASKKTAQAILHYHY